MPTRLPLTGMNILHVVVISFALPILILWGRKPAHMVSFCAGVGQLGFLAFHAVAGNAEVYPWYFVPLAGVASLILATTIDAAIGRVGAEVNGRRTVLSLAIYSLGVLIAASSTSHSFKYGNRRGIDVTDYRGPSSLASVTSQAGVHRVLAFDRPGQIAFFDGLSVYAVDGLTTNIHFQRNLSERGLRWLIEQYRIDAFIGPKYGHGFGHELCGLLYLRSTRFSCSATGEGAFETVQFFSRLTGRKIGELDLSSLRRVTFWPDRELALYLLNEAYPHYAP